MRHGSPISATSVLLDKTARLVDPAVGLGTAGKLGIGHLVVIVVLSLLLVWVFVTTAGSGAPLGIWTGTESGNFPVSHRKYREAQGRVGSELVLDVL